jgi:hypothetical protein
MDRSRKPRTPKIIPRFTASLVAKIPGKLVKREVLGVKLVLFPHHARARMQQRRVSEDEVFLLLEKPDQEGLPTERGRFHWRKGRLHVVFEKRPEKLTIVTTYKK